MMSETIAEILQAHHSGTSPEETIARTYARIRAHNDPAIFITLRDEAEARAASPERHLAPALRRPVRRQR
jgi:allophanate hydrolase